MENPIPLSKKSRQFGQVALTWYNLLFPECFKFHPIRRKTDAEGRLPQESVEDIGLKHGGDFNK
ncbi:unnamed protein product [Linum tenue]|uniref:Uncharacterized protein n=1 Tax=Linum tenue TaxID=586396 RepID=A0AAV0PXG8_9ROSI|nr:unnamed protein product [Linum tenue]